MTNTNTLRLFTTPSTYISFDYGHQDEPYRRIVAVQWERVMQWSHLDPADPATAYASEAITEEKFEVPAEFGQRTMQFFTRFYAGQRDPKEQARIRVNCHRYGRWMINDRRAMKPNGHNPPGELIPKLQVVDGPLPVGVRGVIGELDTKYKVPQALHSLIGLGEDIPDCVQVMGQHGFMGLDGYQKLLEEYRRGNDTMDLHLYGPRPKTSARWFGRLSLNRFL
jgi:hypothetical protein